MRLILSLIATTLWVCYFALLNKNIAQIYLSTLIRPFRLVACTQHLPRTIFIHL